MQLSAFEQFLNLQVEENSVEKTLVCFPAQELTLNLGGTLHGGASMALISMAARRALYPHVANLQHTIRSLDQSVRFISTTRGEKVLAEAVVIKKGKELAFVDVKVTNDEDKLVSQGLVTLRYGEDASLDTHSTGLIPQINVASYYPENWQPGPMAQWLAQRGFTANLGLKILHAHAGRSVVRLDAREALMNNDACLDEGALATLCDSAGAMAAISMNFDSSRARASTPSLHINYYEKPQDETLLGLGVCRWRQQESFLARVQVAGEQSGKVYADADVLFRIA